MNKAIGNGQWAMRKHLIVGIFILLSIAYCLLPAMSLATIITSDYMEHFKEEDKFVAIGNVKIEKDGTVMYADKAVLYRKTSDAIATGNVIYEDDTALINSERAEVNLDTKTGKLYNALIFMKEQKSKLQKDAKIGYWIKGEDVQKIKEGHYYASAATFTTCDAKAYVGRGAGNSSADKIFSAGSPDWCFKGSNVDLKVGDKLTAYNVTYRVKGMPVLYSPYLWTPIKSKRETGFLFPLIGNSSQKGFQFSPSFFWAIDENKDATFLLDYYAKRGIGKGVEYRYLDFDNKGKWYVYHLKDKELNKTFYEFKGSHEHQLGDIRGFVDINYVNQEEFFKEFAHKRELRVQRFLQSTGEISLPLRNSRLYLLGQHWIDLQDTNAHVPQKLPELGYIVSTTGIGPLMFYMSSNITNFSREKEASGQRIDINPTLSHSSGDMVQFFQSLSLRETFYNLTNAAPYKSSAHRETFEYRAKALSRFMKRYESFTHIMEPSVSFNFIPETHPMPVFDSTELFDKTSTAAVSLYNSATFKNYSLASNLSQSINFNAGDRPLSPTSLDIYFSGPFSLSLNMSYSLNTGKTETFNSSISAPLFKWLSLNLNEYYTRASKIMQYSAGISSTVTKNLSLSGNVYYDAKGQGVRDLTLRTVYNEQCWAIDLLFSRKPGYGARPPEYSLLFLINLKGLGGLKAYEYSSEPQQKS